MARYVLIGRDGPRGQELRKEHRGAHLENLERLAAEGRITFAGPLRDESGGPHGSVIIFEADDLEQARQLAASDPYVVHGVFEGYEVTETVQVFPRTDG